MPPRSISRRTLGGSSGLRRGKDAAEGRCGAHLLRWLVSIVVRCLQEGGGRVRLAGWGVIEQNRGKIRQGGARCAGRLAPPQRMRSLESGGIKSDRVPASS